MIGTWFSCRPGTCRDAVDGSTAAVAALPGADVATVPGVTLRDQGLFLRRWWRDPRGVGAVAPSGRALSRLITTHVDPDGGPVIELGAGTGCFTEALLARGVPAERLAVVEIDPVFAAALAERFPACRVLRLDAARLRRSLFDERAATIVSGLPLLSLGLPTVVRILRGAFERQLREDGAIHQFTYAPRCPVPPAVLRRLGLRATRLGWTPANLPPAFVYRIVRERRAGHGEG
jgi:phosphatidylethanolamine/phosphatidyl-N-methylethanolamine N-methyltransferase